MYLSITKRGQRFWSTDNKSEINVSNAQLIDMVYYLNDNIYVSVGNRVFRQCIGIPMGMDCAPLLANLNLFHFEYIKIIMRKLIVIRLKREHFLTPFGRSTTI
jgi:hypothetical protein